MTLLLCSVLTPHHHLLDSLLFGPSMISVVEIIIVCIAQRKRTDAIFVLSKVRIVLRFDSLKTFTVLRLLRRSVS